MKGAFSSGWPTGKVTSLFSRKRPKTVELGRNGREDAGGRPLWDVLQVREDDLAFSIKQVVLAPELDGEVGGQVCFHDGPRVNREGANLVLPPALVELQGEEDVGGLALAIRQDGVVGTGLEVGVIKVNTGELVTHGGTRHNAGTMGLDQGGLEEQSQLEVIQMIGGELALEAFSLSWKLSVAMIPALLTRT